MQTAGPGPSPWLRSSEKRLTSGCASRPPTRAVVMKNMFIPPRKLPKNANGKYMKRAVASTAMVFATSGKLPWITKCRVSTVVEVAMGTTPATGQSTAMAAFILRSHFSSSARFCSISLS